MGKKELHVAVTIIFASMLSIFALTGGNTEPGEIRQIEDSMRNLRRADNLWISYSYTVADKNETVTTRAEVWADLLTSNWAAEYYVTDMDGTRLYLKRFCDGEDIYTHIDWNGEWTKQPAGRNPQVPYLDSVTAINYGENDITDVEIEENEDSLEISYMLTPEYLASIDKKNLASLEAYYPNNAEENIPQTDENLYMALEQNRQMHVSDTMMIYKIDKNDVLRSGTYSYNVLRPELVTGENGETKLGEEEKIRNLIVFEIRKYNDSFILDRIEQFASEIM